MSEEDRQKEQTDRSVAVINRMARDPRWDCLGRAMKLLEDAYKEHEARHAHSH